MWIKNLHLKNFGINFRVILVYSCEWEDFGWILELTKIWPMGKKQHT